MLIIFYLFFLLLIDFVSLHTVMPGDTLVCISPVLWAHFILIEKNIFKGTFLCYPPPEKLQNADRFISSCFWGFYFLRCWQAHVLPPLSFSFFLPPQCVCMIWNHRGLSVLPEWSGTCGPLLTSFEGRAFCLNVPVKAGQVRLGQQSPSHMFNFLWWL